MQPKVLNLNDVVANMEPMLRPLVGEHITLFTVLSPGLGHVRADPNQLEHVLINLTMNARDAMPDGGTLPSKPAVVTWMRTGSVSNASTPGRADMCRFAW